MEVSLLVPAHNEAQNLPRLVDEVFDSLGGAQYSIELLLVDDNSTDRTPDIVDQLAETHEDIVAIHRTERPGFGNAVKAGLAEASGEVLIPLMADLSDDPADIPRLVEAINEGYDIAYGSRFVPGGSASGYPPMKRLYNRAYNNLVRLLFGIGARDVTNAFKAYRREVIWEIGVENLQSGGFDLTAELPLRAHVLGFTSKEVPVTWTSREAGVSKLNATIKGPQYLRRLLHLFVLGNIAGLRDLFTAVKSGGALRTGLAGLLGVVILIALFTFSGLDEVFTVLTRTNPAWLVVAGGAYLTSFVFRTWRYRVLLRTADHLASRADVFRSIAFGWFVNFLLPARAGDAARGVALKTTADVPFGVATGLVVVERVLDMLILGTAMVVLAGAFVGTQRAGLLAIGAFAIAAVLLVGLVSLILLKESIADRFSDRFPTIEASLAELQEALVRTSRNPMALTLAIMLSVPVWAAEVSTIYLSARAVGVQLTWIVTVTTAIAAFLAQSIPVTPAGIGTYEATITGVLSLFDVGAGEGTAVALVDHFTRVGLVYVIGALSAVHIGFRSRSYFRNRRTSGSDPGAVGAEDP